MSLWEEHFESLLALVKAYIIDIWEERKSKLYGDVECAQQPRPHSPTGDLGEIAGVNGQNSEGMCQGGKPGTGKLYTDVVYVAPPTPVGAWSMAMGLQQRFEYYYYYHKYRSTLYIGMAMVHGHTFGPSLFQFHYTVDLKFDKLSSSNYTTDQKIM